MVVRLKYAKAIGVVYRPPQDVAKKFQLISSYFALEGFDLRSYSNLRVGDAADVGILGIFNMRLKQRAYMYSKFEKSKSRTPSTCRPQMPLFTTKASKRSSFVFNVKSEDHTALYFSIAPCMALPRFRKMSRGWTN